MKDQQVTDYRALIRDDRVHGSLYVDPAVYEDEMDRIFTRGWVFVGHESEIPHPGEWVTRRLGREPVIMVRDRSNTVQVLANRCATAARRCVGRRPATTPRSNALTTLGPSALMER